VEKCANYEQNKSQINKKVDRLYIKPDFMHAQETTSGPAGANLTKLHVGKDS
jgi:hypothetical protein